MSNHYPVCQCGFIPGAEDYSERYDSYACPHCHAWIEAGYGKPDCEYCAERPERPASIVGSMTREQLEAYFDGAEAIDTSGGEDL